MPAPVDIFGDDACLHLGGGTLGHPWGNGAVAIHHTSESISSLHLCGLVSLATCSSQPGYCYDPYLGTVTIPAAS
jgi:hypothetical protein